MLGFPFRDPNKCKVTNPYGVINPSYGSGKHDGIDIVSNGDRTIISICNGRVIRSGWNNSWGNYVVVEMSNKWSVVYAHMKKIYVSIGNNIKTGHAIGMMGNTGHSFGDHLHIEIQTRYYESGRTQDIAKYLGIENVKGKIRFIQEEQEEEEMRYQKLEEIPSWGKPTIEKLIKMGILRGEGTGLNLSEDMIRMFVLHDRLGLYK